MAKEGNPAGKGGTLPGTISATLCGAGGSRNSKRLAHFMYQQLQTSLRTATLRYPEKKTEEAVSNDQDKTRGRDRN